MPLDQLPVARHVCGLLADHRVVHQGRLGSIGLQGLVALVRLEQAQGGQGRVVGEDLVGDESVPLHVPGIRVDVDRFRRVGALQRHDALTRDRLHRASQERASLRWADDRARPSVDVGRSGRLRRRLLLLVGRGPLRIACLRIARLRIARVRSSAAAGRLLRRGLAVRVSARNRNFLRFRWVSIEARRPVVGSRVPDADPTRVFPDEPGTQTARLAKRAVRTGVGVLPLARRRAAEQEDALSDGLPKRFQARTVLRSAGSSPSANWMSAASPRCMASIAAEPPRLFRTARPASLISSLRAYSRADSRSPSSARATGPDRANRHGRTKRNRSRSIAAECTARPAPEPPLA